MEFPLHSITELAGRLYKSTKGIPLEVLNNAESKERIVSPMISTVQSRRAPAKIRNAAIISIFYSTSLRLNEIADLKVGDIDLETARVDSFDKRQK